MLMVAFIVSSGITSYQCISMRIILERKEKILICKIDVPNLHVGLKLTMYLSGELLSLNMKEHTPM